MSKETVVLEATMHEHLLLSLEPQRFVLYFLLYKYNENNSKRIAIIFCLSIGKRFPPKKP